MIYSEIEPLKYENQNFAVERTIEDCPATMMIRELVMNAIEAAKNDPSGAGRIEIDTVDVKNHSAPKLRIWNTGRGMNDSELRTATNLSSSLNKVMSLDANFGIGAKVASLRSNKLGLRYRSCRAGDVSQVILIGDESENGHTTYGRYRYQLSDTLWDTVINVNATIDREGKRDRSKDWTEVVLYGNRDDQNTALDPYGDGASDKHWLARELYLRFYRTPTNVSIRLHEDANARNSARYFKPWSERHDKFNHVETVTTLDGIKIHYYDDPSRSAGSSNGHTMSTNGALCSFRSLICLVYKDEMYDVREGFKWTNVSPVFGVPFGAKNISIFIELPGIYGVRPNSNRNSLQYTGPRGGTVEVTDPLFQNLVRDYMPQHFRDLIASYTPKTSASDDVERELQDMLQDCLLRQASMQTKRKGAGEKVKEDPNADLFVGTGDRRHVTTEPNPNPRPKTPRNKFNFDADGAPTQNALNFDKAPKIHLLRDEQQIAEKGIVGKAGKLFEAAQPSQQDDLFINMLYPSVDEVRHHLMSIYAASDPDNETVREIVNSFVDKIIASSVGRAVIHAKVKKLNGNWDRDAIEKALSPETLSIAADDWLLALPTYKAQLSRKFTPSKMVDSNEIAVEAA